MNYPSDSRERTFGFLTALESAEYGYFGGYLIITGIGRPLEFHCSAPIRPSRAQEILYGATLRPLLMGEQIGGALLAKAKGRPTVVLTDHSAVLQARMRSNAPLALITANQTPLGKTDFDQEGVEASGYVFHTAPAFEGELASIVEVATQLAQNIDLMEPFQRIQEAIREAQRIGERNSISQDRAA